MALTTPDKNELQISSILSMLYEVYGYDFRDYARASIHRRVSRFLNDLGFAGYAEMEQRLRSDASLFEMFLLQVTVNVTEMFRDPLFYKELRDNVISSLATYPIIKIWHAGCSTGEEVFSMAILLHEAGLLQRTKIYATDINIENIEKAKKGIIPLAGMKDYTSNYIKAGGQADFASYYSARYDNAIISKALRSNILFSQHNLVTDQVFNEFQLILCRNVMIYFNRQLQNKVVHLFYNSLSRFGYLALGIKESLLFTDIKNNFEETSEHTKIFRRIK